MVWSCLCVSRVQIVALCLVDGCFCLFNPSRQRSSPLPISGAKTSPGFAPQPAAVFTFPSLSFSSPAVFYSFTRPWSSPRPQVRASRFFCHISFILSAEPLACSHCDATRCAHHRQYFSTRFSSVVLELRRTPSIPPSPSYLPSYAPSRMVA
jgi:hypothetical protein